MKRRALLAVVVIAAVILFTQSLPPAPLILPAVSHGVRGAIHVHTNRSDGSGTVADIAAAASRAGLEFVILTDHGDGMRTPEPPAYHHGVLMLDALEVGGAGGHVVALGLPKTSYPLGGEVRDVVEDVTRLGGMAIAAHPGSTKTTLRWTEWASPFHGLEWLNLDSEARDEGWPSLARALLAYPIRSAGALTRMLDRPDAVLRRWDVLTTRRRVVGLAGADAHARLGVSSDESRVGLGSVRIPSYESTLRVFSLTLTDVTLSGNAEQDAAAVLSAVRAGHVYSAVDGSATPAAASFRAVRGAESWQAGDFVPPGTDVELQVDSNAPPGSRIVLLRDGKVDVEAAGPALRRTVPGAAAVYRVEIHVPDAPGRPPVPWVVTNPLYFRTQDDLAPPRGDAKERAPLYEDGDASAWRIETSQRSKAALHVVRNLTGREVLVRWALGGSLSESPYAAVAVSAGQLLPAYGRLTFTGRSDHPMRVSVQFRAMNGDRWRRSVYLDEQRRTVTVFFDDVRPAGPTAEPRLTLAAVRDLLFVVDSVNAKPGMSGQFWIDDLQYGR